MQRDRTESESSSANFIADRRSRYLLLEQSEVIRDTALAGVRARTRTLAPSSGKRPVRVHTSRSAVGFWVAAAPRAGYRWSSKGVSAVTVADKLLVVLTMATAIACHREAPDEDPERLVKEFIERTRSVYGDPRIARGAFELLWSSAQKNLTERAARASALANRKVAPEEMLALTKFSLRFAPRKYTAAVQGDVAVVSVAGDIASGERADVRCVREQGRWRIVLDLPPLSPIQRRPDANNEDE